MIVERFRTWLGYQGEAAAKTAVLLLFALAALSCAPVAKLSAGGGVPSFSVISSENQTVEVISWALSGLES